MCFVTGLCNTHICVHFCAIINCLDEPSAVYYTEFPPSVYTYDGRFVPWFCRSSICKYLPKYVTSITIRDPTKLGIEKSWIDHKKIEFLRHIIFGFMLKLKRERKLKNVNI